MLQTPIYISLVLPPPKMWGGDIYVALNSYIFVGGTFGARAQVLFPIALFFLPFPFLRPLVTRYTSSSVGRVLCFQCAPPPPLPHDGKTELLLIKHKNDEPPSIC